VGRHELFFSGGNEEFAVAHDLLFAVCEFEPDVETESDNIDVGAGAPGSAGVFAIGIAEGDVDAGKFFVLENVANDAGDADVGADSELADAIGVFIGVGVGPEVALELLVGTRAGDDSVLRDLNGERCRCKQSVAGAEPVADDAIDNEGAVDFAGRGEAFTTGQVAPFLRRDDAGGLEPLVGWIHLGEDAGAGGSGGADAGGAAHAIEYLLTEAVDLIVVGAHAIAHDLRCDVDHVSVAHAAAVDDVGHLHAGLQLIGLHLNSEDGDLRSLHVFEHSGRHVDERARREIFKDESVERAATLGELSSDGCGDGLGDAVGDEGDLFVLPDAQTGEDGRAGAGDEFGRIGLRQQV